MHMHFFFDSFGTAMERMVIYLLLSVLFPVLPGEFEELRFRML